MTPKEKANELVHRYLINIPIPLYIDEAKKCALIAVDEILFVVKQYNDTQLEFKYFNEVKDEIEKL